MTVAVLVRCPRCYRIIHLSADQHTGEQGTCYIDAGPVWWAMSIHIRSRCGCIAGRRRT